VRLTSHSLGAARLCVAGAGLDTEEAGGDATCVGFTDDAGGREDTSAGGGAGATGVAAGAEGGGPCAPFWKSYRHTSQNRATASIRASPHDGHVPTTAAGCARDAGAGALAVAVAPAAEPDGVIAIPHTEQ
jgi:hypothetical protein